MCEQSEAEHDFYDALFKRSKVSTCHPSAQQLYKILNNSGGLKFVDYYPKLACHFLMIGLSSLVKLKLFLCNNEQVQFDQFVAQGKVLHNYANILELLLRLRQCCNHPFLVMRLEPVASSVNHRHTSSPLDL